MIRTDFMKKAFMNMGSHYADFNWNDTAINRIALTITLVFVLFLMVWGWNCHPIESFGPECDGYVERAQLLQEGTIPPDKFRPLLYPILAALIGTPIKNPFIGARIVSNIAAGIFVYCLYWVGAKGFTPKVGLISLLFTITNFHVIQHGILASTDMLYVAFTTLALLIMIKIIAAPNQNYKYIVWLGVVFALSYFTRYQAILFLPIIVLGFYLTYRKKNERELKRLLVYISIFAITTIIILIPHFILTIENSGKLFNNENWRNLALKLYGNNLYGSVDFSYLETTSFHGMLEVILYSPEHFLKSGIRELITFFRSGLSGLLGLSPILIGLFYLSCYTLLFSIRPTSLLLIFFMMTYILGICFTFFAQERIMLPVLGICYIIIAQFLVSYDRKVYIKNFALYPLFVLTILLSIVKIIVFIPDIERFVKRHPLQEVATAIQLEKKYGTDIIVVGTTHHFILRRHIQYHYIGLPLEFFFLTNKDLYRRLDNVDADYLLVGRLPYWMLEQIQLPAVTDLHQRLLLNHDTPEFLRPVSIDSEVSVYKIMLNHSPE